MLVKTIDILCFSNEQGAVTIKMRRFDHASCCILISEKSAIDRFYHLFVKTAAFNQKNNIVDKNFINRLVFMLVPFSLCFSRRLSAVLAIIYVLSVILQGDLPARMRKAMRYRWIIPFVLLYVLHLVSLFWTEDLAAGWFVLEKKAALLMLPLALALDRFLSRERLQDAMVSLILGCTAAFWLCVLNAIWQYRIYHDTVVFYYHSFAWPLDQFNAVYFSLYVFFSLVSLDHLVRRADYPLFRRLPVRIVVFASLMLALLMLASKLFIVLSFLFLVYVALRESRLRGGGRKGTAWVGTVGAVLIVGGVLSLGFARDRFTDLFESQFEVVNMEQYSYDTPFNGLTIRLVLLRFGAEILNRPGVWLTGTGAGDTQNEINDLIRKYNLYHGNPHLGDKGYLDYNVHNQFVETLLQTGVGGLLCWILILVQASLVAIRRGAGSPFFFLVLAILLFATIESLLERQRGILFLTFYFSIFYLNPEEEHLKI